MKQVSRRERAEQLQAGAEHALRERERRKIEIERGKDRERERGAVDTYKIARSWMVQCEILMPEC